MILQEKVRNADKCYSFHKQIHGNMMHFLTPLSVAGLAVERLTSC